MEWRISVDQAIDVRQAHFPPHEVALNDAMASNHRQIASSIQTPRGQSLKRFTGRHVTFEEVEVCMRDHPAKAPMPDLRAHRSMMLF